MTHSNRGAARVSIMWMISVGVVAILSITYAFLQNGTIAELEIAANRAKTEEATAKEERFAAIEVRRQVSEVLGFNAADSEDFNSNLTAAGDSLELLRSVFSDLEESHATYEEIVPIVISQYNAAQNNVAQAISATNNAKSATAAAQASLSQVTSDKDTVIRGQQSDISDAQAGFDTREADLSRQLTSAQDRVRELETELNAEKATNRQSTRDMKAVLNAKNTKLALLSDQTRPFRAPANLNPDGQVLEVSKGLPLAWIDLGSSDRLVLGTRFRIEAGNLGERTLKAWGEVIEVKADMAKIRIFDQADKFNPVVEGDYLLNPVYDPKGGFNAVLVGRFSGLYGKAELTILLEKIGIYVQDELDLTTNFLIAGAPVMQDEDGYPLEDPQEVKDMPVYKQAEADNVQIISLASIQNFFAF
ncbi:MAG: hypothetical protein P8N31_15080 [Planctomycetota bacterium]|nr:hypothetical protein [Planctomycetota bacterium]MDG2144873.1 hypothetical protein [Planctomycetota bacterium]